MPDYFGIFIEQSGSILIIIKNYDHRAKFVSEKKFHIDE